MNHVAKALSRVIWQYRDSPKLKEWLTILPSIAQTEIEDPLQKIADMLDIDHAPIEMLKIVGRIVGLGFEFEEISGPDSLTIFRILIKSKITKNTSDATVDGIARAVAFIIPNNSITVIDNQDMTFSVSFGSDLLPIERYMLTNFDLLPRPQGVKMLGFTEAASLTQFLGPFAHFGDPRAQFNSLF